MFCVCWKVLGRGNSCDMGYDDDEDGNAILPLTHTGIRGVMYVYMTSNSFIFPSTFYNCITAFFTIFYRLFIFYYFHFEMTVLKRTGQSFTLHH